MSKENIVGAAIRALRKSKGLTQEQLAEKIGIDFKHLSKIELGKHLPTYYVLKKLEEILDFNIYSLDEKSAPKDNVPDKTIFKSLQILYSAKTPEEKEYYYETLRLAQKGLKINLEKKNTFSSY